MIPMTDRKLTPSEQAAIQCFRRISGDLPFVCLAEGVMLLLSPGSTSYDARLQEARTLMAANLRDHRGVLVHHLQGGLHMVRTMQDLCILGLPGSTNAELLRKGLDACRRGRILTARIGEFPAAEMPLAA